MHSVTLRPSRTCPFTRFLIISPPGMFSLANSFAKATNDLLRGVARKLNDLEAQMAILDTNNRDEKSGSNDDLEMARNALTLVSMDDPDWLRMAEKLAHLLWKRFMETDRDAPLVECIQVRRQICAVRTTDDSSRATAMCDLGLMLRVLFERKRVESLLVESIDVYR
jgi:hypothetical protein